MISSVILAVATVADSTATYIGSTMGIGREGNPLFAAIAHNFWLLTIAMILTTAIYILFACEISKKYKTLKMYHYVSWAAFWHTLGALSWVI